MKLNEIYQAKHEFWLKILFSSFAISDQKIKDELYEFSQMQYRHLKWISNKCKDENIQYNYERYAIDIQKNTTYEYFEYLIFELQLLMKNYNPDDALFARIISDEFYLIQRLTSLLQKSKNETISAFNTKRVYENKNLSQESTDALTKFLFEETYKEYELIFVYAYMQNYTSDVLQYNIYQDLIDESQYHLKCFGNMLAKMGILAIPRVVIEQIYKVNDIKQFLIDGIEEEKAAKQECINLSNAVKDEELSSFFDFINFQENYHIELMQKAIKVL